MTSGASNVIKLIQVQQTDKPGIIWVQFDHADVGEKTRHDNRQLYIEGIGRSWTPIKPSTTQFAVGRTKSVQVVRNQFALRPATAKTIYRSQGDTGNRIVVNSKTRRAVSHVRYLGLSRVTTIDSLYITDLCENKIAVSDDVQNRSRTEGQLSLSDFLNPRSSHKDLCDVLQDLNYTSPDVNIFSETRYSRSESDHLYLFNNETDTLFRNDAPPRVSENTRPFGGTAVYSRLDHYPGYAQFANRNGVEITILRFIIIPHVTIVGVYRSPAVSIREFCSAIKETIEALPTQLNIFIGDFNVNWFSSLQRALLYNLFIR